MCRANQFSAPDLFGVALRAWSAARGARFKGQPFVLNLLEEAPTSYVNHPGEKPEACDQIASYQGRASSIVVLESKELRAGGEASL